MTVSALASYDIPVGGEHRLIVLTFESDGLHDGQRISTTLAMVAERSVQDRSKGHPGFCPGLSAETFTPRQEDMLK